MDGWLRSLLILNTPIWFCLPVGTSPSSFGSWREMTLGIMASLKRGFMVTGSCNSILSRTIYDLFSAISSLMLYYPLMVTLHCPDHGIKPWGCGIWVLVKLREGLKITQRYVITKMFHIVLMKSRMFCPLLFLLIIVRLYLLAVIRPLSCGTH